MKIFVQVVQQGSFAAAARSLRISTASASKHVGALESRIGTRLFDRTTRRVGLTEAGHLYLERCLECLQAFDDADASVRELTKQPAGVLRVAAPIDLGTHLMPVVAEVMKANSGLVVDLGLSNRSIDMVEEGYDVAVRVAMTLDGRYVARALARSQMAIFGCAEYLAAHGRPTKPDDLAKHRTVVFAEPRLKLHELSFTRGRREVRVKLDPVMTTNNGDALREAIVRGVGLGTLPSFLSSRDVAAGRLEPLLPEWSLPDLRMFALYPHRRFLSPKVRVFVDALVAAFGDGTCDPWSPRSGTV